MWFNIILENHGPVRSLENLAPIVDYLRATLSLCGHDVTVSYNQLHPTGINLYLEHFIGPAYAEKFRTLRRSHGMKIGVVATELMISVGGKRIIPYAKHGITYDDGRDEERRQGRADSLPMDHILEQRMIGFDAVLPEVDFVWALLERTADECRAVAKVSEFFPVGCVGLLDDSVRKAPKDLDVVFFGKNTPHRTAVLQAMKQRGIRVVAVGEQMPGLWVPHFILGSLLDRAKIGLNLTLHAANEAPPGVDPRFASCLRVVDLLRRKLLVVSEEIPRDNPYAAFMESGPVADLANLCGRFLQGNAWAEQGARHAANFCSGMDVRKLCGPVIARTLAAMS